MFGTRRIRPRLLGAFAFVSVIFLYFLINNKHYSVENADMEVQKIPGNRREKSTEKSQIDLVVVEEHQEVLEYWFDAANKGKIPKSGNVLLHIDAHSDMAPPEMVDGYPVFRWPQNKSEVKAMMQSNDVFIQAAAMTGFFKKVIWVWPSWDEETHDGDDVSQKFGGGVAVFSKNKNEQLFCECKYSGDDNTKKYCQFVNRTMFLVEADYDGSPIEAKYCDIKTDIIFQQLVDYSALNELILGKLVGKDESLLLDIDEDFFGCVLRGHSLLDAGIPWNDVEEIDGIMDEIFCPRLTKQEHIAHSFMQGILALVIKHCKSSQQASVSCITPKNPTSKKFVSEVNLVIKRYSEKGIFCDHSIIARQRRLEILIEYFIQLTIPQIRACSDLGFCLETSPRSFQGGSFHLCHGANEPNTTIITQHLPGENELALRLKRLRRMLKVGKYPTPAMVTLCRSVRDGYTSVKHFEDIEEQVLDSIHDSREDVNFNVIYDTNLLGGIKGWPSRQRAAHVRKATKNVN